MNEQNAASGEGWAEESDPDGFKLEDFSAKDGVLDLLLDFIVGPNDDGAGVVGLTLQSNGATISGLAISRRAYLDEMDKLLRPGFGEAITDAFKQILDEARADVLAVRARRDEAGLPLPARQFVHLKEARVFTGTQVDVPIWRGSLSEVTGWSLGSHNPPRAGGS